MILKTNDNREPAWKPINTKQGSFEVLIRKPTYEDVLLDLASTAERAIQNRIENLVSDWRGVTDQDGKPVKFSIDALVTAIESCPEVGLELILAIGERYAGDPPKNLPSPSATISAGGQTETNNTMTSSDSSFGSEITPHSSLI